MMAAAGRTLLPWGFCGAARGRERFAGCRRRRRGAWRWRAVVLAACLAALPRPPAACAHGEAHLLILELTRQIEAATNNAARLYLERGELQREHGMYDGAEADYARAARLDPELPGVDRCQARLLADLGQLAAARARFDRALERCPDDGESRVGRARVLLRLDQRRAAIADYWRGLEHLREPPPEYVVELARALVAEEQTAEALRALDAGIKKLGPILPLQGYALELELARQNPAAALARLETILARALRKETWFARRGEIFLATGKVIEARQSYHAALAAIDRLPGRLQQSPSMVKLRADVKTALAGLTNAPAAGPSK